MADHLALSLNKSEAQALLRMLQAVPLMDPDASMSECLAKRLVMAMHAKKWPNEAKR